MQRKGVEVMHTEVCPDSGRTEKVMVDWDKKKCWIDREGESKIPKPEGKLEPEGKPTKDKFDEWMGW